LRSGIIPRGFEVYGIFFASVHRVEDLCSIFVKNATFMRKQSNDMNTIIVSDLHMGSPYFLVREFDRFLRTIPDDCLLILNGDIIDNAKTKLPLPHRQILERLEKRSLRRPVIWVQGNHDNGFVSNSIGNIEFRPIYQVDHRILVAHGHDFDEIMPRSRLFIKAFTYLHQARIALGMRPAHVAHYAKKWKRLYKLLRDNIIKNAVLCAREQGCDVVVCGHTHFAEERDVEGIRYINTGAWTEHPPYFLQATGHQIMLRPFNEIGISRASRQRSYLQPTGTEANR